MKERTSRTRLGRRLVGLAVGVNLALSCNDPVAPIPLDATYSLELVNGAILPFTFPSIPHPLLGPLVIETGSISILDETRATRQERRTQLFIGGSVPINNYEEWSFTGQYRRNGSRLIIEYSLWTPGGSGPSSPADTFEIVAGQLTLHQLEWPTFVTRVFVGAK